MMDSHQAGQQAGEGGKGENSSSSGGEQQQQQQLPLGGNSGAFISVDGNMYLNGDNTAYEDFTGVFSSGDLYSIGINVENPGNNAEVAEVIESWQQGNGFISLDTENIGKFEEQARNGAECSGDSESLGALGFSNGNFYRLMLNEEKPGLAAQNGSDGAVQNPGESSGGIPVELGTGVNIPDPLEAAASPAAGVQASDLNPPKVRKPRGRKPKAVKEAEAAAAAAAMANISQPSPASQETVLTQSGLNIGRPLTVDEPRPSVTVHHYPDGSKMEYRQPMRQLISLDQLAQHDRNLTLMRSGVPPSQQQTQYRPPSAHYRVPSDTIAPEYYSARMRSPQDFSRPTPDGTQARGGRLDQFFSSRIPAPSNKAVVKPKLIQENKQIYNLLTAPTPHHPQTSGMKLSQERWMQCPNPSIIPNEHDPSKQVLPPAQQPQQVDNSRYYCLPSRINVHRDANAYIQTHRPSGSSANYNPSTPHHELRYEDRYEMLKQDVYELRCRNHYLTRVNKQLMYRLRLSYEQNESLRAYFQENSQFQGFGGGSGYVQDPRAGPEIRRLDEVSRVKEWAEGNSEDNWQLKRSERSVSTSGPDDEDPAKPGKIRGDDMKRRLSSIEEPFAIKKVKEEVPEKDESLKPGQPESGGIDKPGDKNEVEGNNSPGANSVATEVVSVADDGDNSTSTLFSSPHAGSRPMAPPSAPPVSFPSFQLGESAPVDAQKLGNFQLVGQTKPVT